MASAVNSSTAQFAVRVETWLSLAGAGLSLRLKSVIFRRFPLDGAFGGWRCKRYISPRDHETSFSYFCGRALLRLSAIESVLKTEIFVNKAYMCSATMSFDQLPEEVCTIIWSKLDFETVQKTCTLGKLLFSQLSLFLWHCNLLSMVKKDTDKRNKSDR